ncbi:MAG TPA: GGDEF domain-containing protein [Candidatus Acidoferrales bacterium]|nr:GGDEF domain-containing protein [Candidatus Acidoferrales bacterium]
MFAESPIDSGIEEMQRIRASLARLERRDWWLWSAAVVVMLLLTVAVVSMSLPALMADPYSFFQFHLEQSVRGLVGVVLLFNLYTIYQQVLIKRLRGQLASQIEMMASLRLRANEYHKLAMVDPLTGLYNRRFAEQRLTAEVDRSKRYGHPLTVVVIDLNDFKQINDKFGHLAGDLVLKEFGLRLSRSIRVSDLAVRMGGDEFLVILPECPAEQIPGLLTRLANLEVNYRGSGIPVRFSAGVAGFDPLGTPEQMLERADQALYAQKSEKHPPRQAAAPAR